ncbi:hypothetical protein [Methylopila sp. M107]|uniref:hypothetical protein n=1 Tax=Methylopila sp. M107 TaxID=1101190 RepID=UPI000378BA6C|nr:hypothetical protein [Methylopila sp. M107]
MTEYTNTTKGVLDFVTGGKPDAPEFTSFKPGETRDVELNLEHPAVKGALLSGALVSSAKAGKRAAKGESLPAVS